jgi:hypothetical protein
LHALLVEQIVDYAEPGAGGDLATGEGDDAWNEFIMVHRAVSLVKGLSPERVFLLTSGFEERRQVLKDGIPMRISREPVFCVGAAYGDVEQLIALSPLAVPEDEN